jgi:organic radical activating enzyme
MPKKVAQPVIEEVEKPLEKPKKGRTMTPEMLEKLKVARELALKAKKEGKKINEELDKAKKETFSEKIDQVETYKKLKSKVEEEVKQNEIVAINQRLNDIHSKFDGFLQDRERRKQEKAQRKEDKKTKEIVKELPAELARRMIQEQLREQQLADFRARYF